MTTIKDDSYKISMAMVDRINANGNNLLESLNGVGKVMTFNKYIELCVEHKLISYSFFYTEIKEVTEKCNFNGGLITGFQTHSKELIKKTNNIFRYDSIHDGLKNVGTVRLSSLLYFIRFLKGDGIISDITYDRLMSYLIDNE